MKPTIAIIGATGKRGTILAKSLATTTCRLLLFSHESEKLEALGREIRELNTLADFEGMGCPVDASWEADIVITDVPSQDKKEVAQRIKQVATQKIVIDVTNALDAMSISVLENLLPDSKVIEMAIKFPANPSEHQAEVLIAGRDEEALQLLCHLLLACGLHPVIHTYLPVTNPAG